MVYQYILFVLLAIILASILILFKNKNNVSKEQFLADSIKSILVKDEENFSLSPIVDTDKELDSDIFYQKYSSLGDTEDLVKPQNYFKLEKETPKKIKKRISFKIPLVKEVVIDDKYTFSVPK
jgi:hypothetical protein